MPDKTANKWFYGLQ